MEENSIVLPHSWHLVNESFIIGIKPDVAIHKTFMICLLLGIPPITVTLHLSMIYLLMFSSKKHKYTNVFYKIVVATSFTVIYWSWYFFYQGLCQLLGYSLFGEVGNVIVASIAQYLFYVCMNMDFLIAMNRFSAVVLMHRHDNIFTPTKGILYIAAIYLGSAFFNIPGFIFLTKYYPELGTYNYFHKPSESFLKTSIYIEMTMVYAVHAGIIFMYASAFMKYKRMQSMTSQHKKERRLLIQAIISGSPCFMFMIFHHLIHFPLLEVIAGELCVGIDPLVYLWFNKEIRADFLEVVGFTHSFSLQICNSKCVTKQSATTGVSATDGGSLTMPGTLSINETALTPNNGGGSSLAPRDGSGGGTQSSNVLSKRSNKISNVQPILPALTSTRLP